MFTGCVFLSGCWNTEKTNPVQKGKGGTEQAAGEHVPDKVREEAIKAFKKYRQEVNPEDKIKDIKIKHITGGYPVLPSKMENTDLKQIASGTFSPEDIKGQWIVTISYLSREKNGDVTSGSWHKRQSIWSVVKIGNSWSAGKVGVPIKLEKVRGTDD